MAHTRSLPPHQYRSARSALRLVNRHWRSAVDDSIRSLTITHAPADRLAGILRRWQHLEVLNLMYSELGEAAIQALGRCRRLQQLSFTHFAARSTSGPAEPRLWQEVAVLPALHSLNIERMIGGTSVGALAALAACSSLTGLALHETSLQVSGTGQREARRHFTSPNQTCNRITCSHPETCSTMETCRTLLTLWRCCAAHHVFSALLFGALCGPQAGCRGGISQMLAYCSVVNHAPSHRAAPAPFHCSHLGASIIRHCVCHSANGPAAAGLLHHRRRFPAPVCHAHQPARPGHIRWATVLARSRVSDLHVGQDCPTLLVSAASHAHPFVPQPALSSQTTAS